MSELEVIQVIHTQLARRGLGVEGDPFRSLDQYWLMDGTLLFEYDSFARVVRSINGEFGGAVVRESPIGIHPFRKGVAHEE